MTERKTDTRIRTRQDELNLPRLPTEREKLTSEQTYALIVEFLRQIAILAKFVDRNYKFHVVHRASSVVGSRENRPNGGDDERTLETIYGYVLEYALRNSKNGFFTNVLKYKLPGEDIERKSSLRTHLFWETCRLYAILRTLKSTAEKCTKEDLRFVRNELGLTIHAKHPAKFSQREMNQAFFLLSAKWKTVAYGASLARYVRSLTLRMCEFFCYSSTAEEMDDEDLRDVIPMSAIRRRPTRVGRRSDSNRPSFDDEESSSRFRPPTRFYRPNLDFVMMCQFRFYRFEGDVYFYESIPKVVYDESTLSDYVSLTKISHRRKSGVNRTREYSSDVPTWILDVSKRSHPERKRYARDILENRGLEKKRWALLKTTTVDVDDWLSVDLMKRFSVASFRLVSPELKEKTSSRYVYCSFSEADRDWLKYKNPPSMPSFMDEYVCKECKDEAYDVVVKKAGRGYEQIFREDSNDPSAVGFYEWCAIKSVSRLFALGFDMFNDGLVFGREDLYGKTEEDVFDSAGRRDEPTLMQFFSSYRVYHRGTYYVPEGDHDGKDIYDAMMLWICISLNESREKKIAKTIESSLKKKHAEYAAKSPEMQIGANSRGEETISPAATFGIFKNPYIKDDIVDSFSSPSARARIPRKKDDRNVYDRDFGPAADLSDDEDRDHRIKNRENRDDDEENIVDREGKDGEPSEHQHPSARSSEPMGVLFSASQRDFHDMEEEEYLPSSSRSRESKNRRDYRPRDERQQQQCPPSFFFF